MANSLEQALYVVATPIGNLCDITFRAIDVLKNADVVAAEDTRNTSILFEKYDIKTRLISYHKFSETKRVDLFLSYLKEGKSIALVSDAGTPLISDPGEILVQQVIDNGYKVIPVCGASAVITLLSAIPRNREDFKFIGFISRNKNQIIETINKNNSENLIFYESPNRVIETLKIIDENFKNRKIALGRELTKKFEEIKVDSVSNIIKYYEDNPDKLKGEMALMLYPDENVEEFDVIIKIKKLKKLNLKDKEIAKIISSLFDVNKNDVYKICLDI